MDCEREGHVIAFCFPGQGSLEEGMGREIAVAQIVGEDENDVEWSCGIGRFC